MSNNGISTLTYKQQRQVAKLDLAKLKRQGYTLYTDGTVNNGSASFSGSNYLSLATSTAFGFGDEDFTIEMFVYPTSLTGNALYDNRSAASESAIYINLNSTGNVRVYVNGAYVITSTATVSINTWSHIALSRTNGLTKLFVNGSQSGSTYTDANDYGTTKPLVIGSTYATASNYVGSISNIRVVKGVSVYTGAFTTTHSPLTDIEGTQLLLNTANGANFLTDSSINNLTVTNHSSVTSSSNGIGPDTSAIFYRVRNSYDITELPTQYTAGDNNTADVTDNPNPGGLIVGRPWS